MFGTVNKIVFTGTDNTKCAATVLGMDQNNYKIDKSSIISGCKLKYLDVGDKVIIHKLQEGKRKVIELLELVDLVGKWDMILKNDKSHNFYHVPGLEISDSMLRSQVFVETQQKNKLNKNIQVVNRYSNEQISLSEIETLIINLYCEGYSFQEIANRTGLSKSKVFRFIDSILKAVPNGQ